MKAKKQSGRKVVVLFVSATEQCGVCRIDPTKGEPKRYAPDYRKTFATFTRKDSARAGKSRPDGLRVDEAAVVVVGAVPDEVVAVRAFPPYAAGAGEGPRLLVARAARCVIAMSCAVGIT